MAYSSSYTIQKAIIPGIPQKAFRVSITETEVGTTSETVITGLPVYGAILRYKATLTPVLATTIAPRVGLAAGWTADTQDEVSGTATAADHVDNQGPVNYYSPSGTLHIRTTPDVGGDDVDTEILIVRGWST